ncbi:hypothetical protein BD780_001946 [Clostridium tetanomorphum]|uniref:Asparagine synthase n=1 Tax=Clostridium tetanomorphum TaxID=1553 RepID=A0A923EDU6_CLOTT|nr:hypothetical protein [Clostridium tetanomorphum]KAJ49837.1 hypothetical protein CTM_21236 [Clostridium tetanomorphum DSM 665]MBC2399736.1 asparagine synthase [Clostridium tetanomorphum]MBP1865140.1 hypothetical protein [Clostridium tetanomorphum]NRS84721.1 hypothetical protein [Clostridium tetanomorphum]NRZ97937.1 hypothetical protein [Clostridium tetanomorphum]
MKIREGVIPTTLGALVTATAFAFSLKDMNMKRMRKQNITPLVETAVLGFGLAHIVLGVIDIIEHR